MTYLLTRYLLWIVLAAALGLLVGRYTLKHRTTENASGAILLALAVVAIVGWLAALQVAPGRAGHWLEVGLLLLAAYFVGWMIGEPMWRAFMPALAGQGQEQGQAQPFAANAAAARQDGPPLFDAASPRTASSPDGRGDAPASLRPQQHQNPPRSAASAPQQDALRPESLGPESLRPVSLVQPEDGGDDLRALDITPEESRALTGAGVWRIGQIASWGPAHARWIAEHVGVPHARVVEGWVPRARQAMDAAFARAVQPAAADAAAPEGELTTIVGVGPATARALAGWGVTRLDHVAGWGAEDAAHVGARLGEPGRVEREMWIPQARLLVAGVETSGSLARRMGRTRSDGADAPPDAAALARLRAEIEELSEAAGVPVFSAAPPAAFEAASGTNPDEPVSDEFKPMLFDACPREGADDLKLIWGVGPKLEGMLNEMGVYRYAQIAEWSDMNLRWVDQRLAVFKGRAVRDRWIEQAQKLATGWRPQNAVGDRPALSPRAEQNPL